MTDVPASGTGSADKGGVRNSSIETYQGPNRRSAGPLKGQNADQSKRGQDRDGPASKGTLSPLDGNMVMVDLTPPESDAELSILLAKASDPKCDEQGASVMRLGAYLISRRDDNRLAEVEAVLIQLAQSGQRYGIRGPAMQQLFQQPSNLAFGTFLSLLGSETDTGLLNRWIETLEDLAPDSYVTGLEFRKPRDGSMTVDSLRALHEQRKAEAARILETLVGRLGESSVVESDGDISEKQVRDRVVALLKQLKQ